MKKPNLKETGKVMVTGERLSIWLTRKEIVQRAYVDYLKTVPNVSQGELENEQMIHGTLVWAMNLANNILEQFDHLHYYINKSNMV